MRGDDTIKRQLDQRQAEERRRSSGSTPIEDLLDRTHERGDDDDEAPAPRQDEPDRRG